MCALVVALFFVYSSSPPDRKGLLDFTLESAFAMLLHHAPTQYPARAARQWIPPSISPELLASGSRRVSRQSGSPIPPSIPPERLASGSRRASRRVSQSSSPVDPAEYPARQSSSPVDPAKYLTRAARQWIPRRTECPRVARQWIPPSISLSIPCRWILLSIRPVSSRSGLPVFASGSRQYPARAARQSGFA